MSRQRVVDLEIGQDLRFQQQEWRFQRVSWAVMLFVLVAAGLGILGGQGPLSQAVLHTDDASLEVEYERFGHFSRPTRLYVRVEHKDSSELNLWLARGYVQQFQIQRIVPEPYKTQLAGDYLIYSFQIVSQKDVAEIVFYLQPDTSGLIQGQISVEGGTALKVAQFIYP